MTTSEPVTDPVGAPASSPIRLHPDEQIVLDVQPSSWWTLSAYVLTLGLWSIWRKRHRYLLTNQRVVLIKGVINKTEQGIPLDRIQDAQLQRSPFKGGTVMLSTAGGELGSVKIAQLTQADALAFADALTSRIGRRASTSPV